MALLPLPPAGPTATVGAAACCSLRLAASVIALYTSVAYIIAFFVEVWWIWESGGRVPYLGYILTVGYLVSFLLSAILVTGISNRRLSYLVVWMSGLSAILLPEAGLALFMSLQFWRLSTVHGLTEVTSWACRLAVNVGGLVCVQSLYTRWREEKQVIASLRHLNMTACDRSRRNSTTAASASSSSSSGGVIDHNTNSADRRPTSPAHTTTTHFYRWGSVRSLPAVMPSDGGSEFDASLFDTVAHNNNNNTASPTTTITPVHYSTRPPHQLLYRSNSVSYSPGWAQERLNKGYFGPASWPHQHHHHQHHHRTSTRSRSRTSLAESDDAQKYRDVAL